MHAILHCCNWVTVQSNSSLLKGYDLQCTVLQVVTGKLNNTLFLPWRVSAHFKVLEEKSGIGVRNSQNKIGEVLITVGWTWGMGTWGFISSGAPHSHTGARWEPGHTAGGEQRKLHLYLRPLPSTGITTWAPLPVRSGAASDPHRSMNPIVDRAHEGSRLWAPYESHPETIPHPLGLWKIYLPWNWSLVPKRSGSTALDAALFCLLGGGGRF